MIDFHTHILPGIDDGSSGIEESLAMLREEARQGVRDVVLTPHYYAWENSPDEFLERRTRAWDRLAPELTEDMPRIWLGAEVHYFEGICHAAHAQKLKIQGTDLLLLEMPFHTWSNRVMEDVLELNYHTGIQVVLAHIERYLPMQSRQTIEMLMDHGILFQVNLSFFLRWKTRYKARNMLKTGAIQFLGSDCHNMTTRRPEWQRAPAYVRRFADECIL